MRVILSKIIIIEFILWIFVGHLHFRVPYSFLLFSFDLCFVLMMVLEAFLPEKHHNFPLFEEKNFTYMMRIILFIISLLIIWQQWDFIVKKFPLFPELF